MSQQPLLMALPKGRLMDKIQKEFARGGMEFNFKSRELVATDNSGRLKIFAVKNADLPTYIHHGIAGLGVCGEDVIYEAGYDLYKLHTFKFGGTRMCLAGKKGDTVDRSSRLTIATKFIRFASNYFHSRGIPVEIIKLNGSVELAPVLGLTRYIVDLVETGGTLKANNLEVLDTLEEVKVHLVANPAYYKLHYEKIQPILDFIKKEDL